MADFKRSLAVVIGINEYQDYPKLQTARYDAERLAEILAIEHKYDYVILVADETYKEYRQGQELPVQNKYQPTLDGLLNLLSKRLQSEINPTKEDRLLFYFAGHGIPEESDEGPKGYLVFLDADRKKRDSLLPMQDLYRCLAALNCRHFLVVLDCCFAGRFSWSSTRKGRTFPKVIHKEHYDRFINSPAWQAITSASHDQEAFDILGDDNRGTVEGTNHSPFAEGLFKALRGEADVIPASKNGQPAGDGVITATELYLYLRDHVEIGSKERQTPGLWSLPKHERGEYIFLVPGANPKLKPAPKVNEKNNPYRGLESFDEEHSRFFFGREELIEQLFERISAPKQPLIVVLGVSGSGKSSLVKAGLIPCLKKLSQSEVFEVNFVSAYILASAIVQAFPRVSPQLLPINYVHQWHILNPIRPGESPFTALAKAILALADVTGSNQPDTLNFLKVSTRLDNLTFITEILKQKVNELDKKLAESSIENGEKSSETLRLKKEVEKFILMAKGWHQGTKKAKQLLIVEHFEELYTLCWNREEKQQLQQAVSDCLNPLSQRLQSDPNQLIDIVKSWSQKNPGVRLLLTIDQFEELITLSQRKQKDQQNNQQQPKKKFWNWLTQKVQHKNKQEEWQQFLNLLEKTLSANLDQLRILVTLRSDFEPRFLNSDALKSYWAKARFPVRAMRSDELRQAIERPAAEMALYFEPPNLVDRLIDEVGQMPGALPLLSFTLSELYIKLAQKWSTGETSDRALTLDADFDTEGGVAGSLTRRANQEYDDLPDDAHRATLRRVMLRMVTFEGGELARRRVPLSELVYADAVENERVKLVLERFNHARLFVSGQETGEPYVEPAHDFLVRSWDKLQEWQQDEQEDLSLQRRLTPAALEWKSKQEARFLWNADPYLDVLKQVLTDEKDNWFNQVEAEFVQKSVWRRRRNVNLLWGSVIGVILGLSGLTLIARIAQNEAQKQEIDALRQASEANWLANNQLDALIESLRAGKNLKENRLFQVSGNSKQREEVVDTLRKIVYVIRERDRMNKPIGKLFSVTPDRNILVQNSSEQAIRYLNAESKVVMPPEFKFARNRVNYNPGIISSPDGKLLATADIAAIPGSDGLWNWDDTSISGSQENTNKNANVFLWDWDNKKQIVTFSGHQSGVKSFSFSPDSRRLAVVDGEDSIHLWDVESKTKINTIKKPEYNNIVGIGFTPDDELRIATFTTRNQATQETPIQWYGALKLWDDKGNQLLTLYGDTDNQEEFGRAIFSPDGKKIVIEYGNIPEYQTDDTRSIQIFLWDYLEDEMNVNKEKFFHELYSIPVEAGDTSLAVTPDGKQLATTLPNSNVRFWDLEEQNPDLEEINHTAISVSLSADGKQLATADKDGRVGLLNLETNKFISLPKIPVKTKIVRLSADSKKLAIVGQDNTVGVWDLESKKFTSSPQNNSKDNLKATKFTINSIKFSPNSNQLAIERLINSPNRPEKKVSIWDLKTNKDKLQNVKYEEDFIFNSDNKLQLLDVGIGSVEANGEFNVITDLAGNHLINFESTQTKCTLKNMSKYSGIENNISTISNSSNSNLIASGEDNTVCLKDLQGNEVAKLTVPNQQKIKSISLNGDGSLMAILLDDGSIKLWQIGDFDYLLQRGCNWVRHYLESNPNVEESDRRLCDDIPPITPSPQTTIANSSAPSIVQPSAQNAPSPAPSSNNRQDTPSSSAPANAPARPQNVPSPTPSSSNGRNSYEQALSDRKQASKLNSVDVYINQGLTYHRQRNYQQAISNYSQAIALNPNSDKAYSNRAAAYNEQKDYPKAIADSSKAISLNPNYANAYINRGLAYYYQGNSQQAIADYNKAIELAPSNANAYNNRALAYTRLGNQQAAQVDKRKAAALSQRQLR